jgi:hypothetical protein
MDLYSICELILRDHRGARRARRRRHSEALEQSWAADLRPLIDHTGFVTATAPIELARNWCF